MSNITLVESVDLNGRILNCKNALYALSRVKMNINDELLSNSLIEAERLILTVKQQLEQQKIR